MRVGERGGESGKGSSGGKGMEWGLEEGVEWGQEDRGDRRVVGLGLLLDCYPYFSSGG